MDQPTTRQLTLRPHKAYSCGYIKYTPGYSVHRELPRPRRVFHYFYMFHYQYRVKSDITKCERIRFLFVI